MNEDSGHDALDPAASPLPDEHVDPQAASEPAPTEPVQVAPGGEAPSNLPPRPSSGEPVRRSSIAVPIWAFLVIAAALLLGVGFLAGYAIGTDDDHGHREGSRSEHDGSDRAHANSSPTTVRPQPSLPRTPGGTGRGGRAPIRPQPVAPTGSYLGVSVRDSTDPPGAAIIQLGTSGPAAAAGLKRGDVITDFDKTAVKTAAELTAAVRSHQPGAKVSLTYTRNGASATADITLGDRSQLRTQ